MLGALPRPWVLDTVRRGGEAPGAGDGCRAGILGDSVRCLLLPRYPSSWQRVSSMSLSLLLLLESGSVCREFGRLVLPFALAHSGLKLGPAHGRVWLGGGVCGGGQHSVKVNKAHAGQLGSLCRLHVWRSSRPCPCKHRQGYSDKLTQGKGRSWQKLLYLLLMDIAQEPEELRGLVEALSLLASADLAALERRLLLELARWGSMAVDWVEAEDVVERSDASCGCAPSFFHQSARVHT